MKTVIGIDFGTDSVRALVVDAATGYEIASHVHFIPVGQKDGIVILPLICGDNIPWIISRDWKLLSKEPSNWLVRKSPPRS